MVARKTAKERAKLRRRNERLIRRSPVLSLGAKILWLELSEWAWDDPTCYPRQELLVLALQKERSTISRWASELKKHKLISIRRLRRGNEYVLTEEVSSKVCDPARGSNKKLAKLLRGDCDVAEMPSQETRSRSVTSQKRTPDVAEMPHEGGCDVAEMPHPNVAKTPRPIDEVHQEEVRTEEKRSTASEVQHEFRNGPRALEGNESGSDTGARCARANEETAHQPKERTYDPEEGQTKDPSDLMEDPQPKTQHRRRKRGKRQASDDLVARPPGKGLRNASQARDGTNTVEAMPPAPSKPQDVLALLRGEIEAKYGAKACEKLPLDLSRKESGMIRSSILNRYSPQIVIAMVRVLVWDWEAARSSCFPPKQTKTPTIEALVQYQETLAGAADTGLKRQSTARGKWTTYKSRYLSEPTDSTDPF